MEILRKMYNVLTDTYEPILMEDGEIREFNGIRFGAINGIVALKKRSKKGVPRKRPEEFIEYGKKLASKIDVLLLHDSPYIPLPEYQNIVNDERTKAVEEAIKIVKPRIAFCGHLHVSPYTIYNFNGTLYLRIDSSQAHKCYAILNINENRAEIEVWIDYSLTTKKLITLK